jgi:hypothetical protein
VLNKAARDAVLENILVSYNKSITEFEGSVGVMLLRRCASSTLFIFDDSTECIDV